MSEHQLKTHPWAFEDLMVAGKTFEVREDDRGGFEVGDVLNLREWDPERARYTGRAIRRRVVYVLRGPWGPPGRGPAIAAGFAVMALEIA